MKNFKEKKIKAVDIETFNKILDRHRGAHVVFYPWERRQKNENLNNTAFIVDKMVNIEITTMYWEYPHAVTYKCRKDGAALNPTTGRAAFKEFQKCYRSPRLDHDQEFIAHFPQLKNGVFIASAAPLIGYSPEHDRENNYVWVYDTLSAYAEPLLSIIPDTRKKRYNSIIKPGEVGFLQVGARGLVLCEDPGEYADVVCPVMPSPYNEFARRWFDRKQNAKTPEDKLKAKSILTFAIGYLQRTNPLLRCWVVEKCNKKILSLLDDDSILWNTDAIYSLRPRDDIKIGENIGDFRLEYVGELEHKGCNYHKKNSGEYSVRGVPKSWFSDENILTDELPTKTGENMYYFDKEKFKLCINSKYQTLA